MTVCLIAGTTNSNHDQNLLSPNKLAILSSTQVMRKKKPHMVFGINIVLNLYNW